MPTAIERISELRNKRASIYHKQQTALAGKMEAEEALKELGWDGVSPVEEFVARLTEAAADAELASNKALAEAEALAKEFE